MLCVVAPFIVPFERIDIVHGRIRASMLRVGFLLRSAVSVRRAETATVEVFGRTGELWKHRTALIFSPVLNGISRFGTAVVHLCIIFSRPERLLRICFPV